MKLTIINGDFNLKFDDEVKRKDQIRLMNRARNFLKLTIDKLQHDIIREEIAASGQISMMDSMDDQQTNNNS